MDSESLFEALSQSQRYADLSRYGSGYPEAEIVMGARCDDIAYVRQCLLDMTRNELNEFEEVLVRIYCHLLDVREHKLLTMAEAREIMSQELDKIITAHG